MPRKYHRRQVVKAAIASSACLGIAQPTLAETETSEREGGLDAFNSRFEKVAVGNSDSRGVTIQGSTGKQTIQERIRQIEPIFVQTDGRPVFGDEDSPEPARGTRRGSGRRRRRRVGQVPNELLAKSDDY